MPLQEGLQPDEDIVRGGLGVNGHPIGQPYENGNGYLSGEHNRRETSIAPIVSDITTPFPLTHVFRPPPITSRLSVVIKSSPATSSKNQTLFSGPASRERDELSLETVLPTRLQPRKAEERPPGAAIFNMTQEIEGTAQQPRKRGRPKGWKPGTPYRTHNGGPSPANKPLKKPKSSSTAPSQETRRRGRPPKPPDLTIREWYLRSDPKYMPFGCEWHEENLLGQITRCPAELQNMDTLRRHVLFIHGNMKPLICRWGKCGDKLVKEEVGEAANNEAKHQQPEEFVDYDAFCAHMEKEHLESYVWHMGDGPRNNGIATITQESKKLPRYLFGQDGKQVTPSIKDQQFEDIQGMQERKRRLKAIQRQALENAPDESEFFYEPLDTDA